MRFIRTLDGIWEYVGERPYNFKENSKIVGYYFNPKIHRFCSYGYGKLKEKNIVKKSNVLEELIQDDDLALWFKIKVYCDDDYYEYTIKNVLMSIKDARTIAGYGCCEHFDIKDIKEFYIKDSQGNYIKFAERKDEEGALELL